MSTRMCPLVCMHVAVGEYTAKLRCTPYALITLHNSLVSPPLLCPTISHFLPLSIFSFFHLSLSLPSCLSPYALPLSPPSVSKWACGCNAPKNSFCHLRSSHAFLHRCDNTDTHPYILRSEANFAHKISFVQFNNMKHFVLARRNTCIWELHWAHI